MKKYAFVLFVVTIQILLLLSLFYPPLYQDQLVFDATNYYAVISALIGGNMALLVISLQFAVDRNKQHNDKVINARGFFEINYLNEANDIIEPYICRQNFEKGKHWHEYVFVMLRLHSHEVIMNCRVKIKTLNNEKKEKCFENLVGIVVPNQLLGIPIIENSNDISIEITYNTIMDEVILHSLTFSNGIINACIDKGEKITTSLKGKKQKTLIASDSILFKYVHK